MTPSFAIRLEHRVALRDDARRARQVASILTRDSFRELDRVSAHCGDRWMDHRAKSEERIAAILSDVANTDVTLDSKRGKDLVASGAIQNGRVPYGPERSQFWSYLVLPVPQASEVPAVVGDVCDLAVALDAGSGFIAVEPTYRHAHRVALGGAAPIMRPGLSPQRAQERDARDTRYRLRDVEIAVVEWGTFLGPGHLERVDLATVRSSGAFHCVQSLSPQQAFLQTTADPTDDLRPDFEQMLSRARDALTSLAPGHTP